MNSYTTLLVIEYDHARNAVAYSLTGATGICLPENLHDNWDSKRRPSARRLGLDEAPKQAIVIYGWGLCIPPVPLFATFA